ncbi:hypothetical protein [Leucobacter massiliensis]|uniref:Uncharacterized protein n=1 Tax=Leucobacter massiliensis TaxID=1686285 RepID=A0A2S9QMK8_9MICO|nr:hypothetical protein [Leucobacter massiliensis]PRI10834.1 hypothetical protein B4915_08035 [Leucobacter massiliensis]
MTSSPADHPRSLAGWAVLRVLLGLESVFLAWVVMVSVLGALRSEGAAVQNVSIVAMAVVSLLWVLATCIGALRARAPWVRGSALTIHVLLFAGGTGCLQLQIGPWWLGLGIAAAAVLGFFAALLARPELPAAPEELPHG